MSTKKLNCYSFSILEDFLEVMIEISSITCSSKGASEEEVSKKCDFKN
jgi:hypothetical protein